MPSKNRERRYEANRRWRQRNRGKVNAKAMEFYRKNREKYRERWKKYYERTKETRKMRQQEWVSKNRRKLAERTRKKNKILRDKVLNYYGNKCACCSEYRVEFLAIDHIGGQINKKNLKPYLRSGHGFYRQIIREGFPNKYRILCHNCNFSKGNYGYCPHEIEQGLLKKEDVNKIREKYRNSNWGQTETKGDDKQFALF